MLPTENEIASWFTHSSAPPSPDKEAEFIKLHDAGRAFATELRGLLTDCQEAEQAFNALQDAVMWSNAAISRHG